MIALILTKGVLAALFFGGILNLAGLLTWVERKQSAVIQDRVGANRAWIVFRSKWLAPLNWILRPFNVLGLFHALADAVKMFVKENFKPHATDTFLYTLAPAVSFVFALTAFIAIPFGNTLSIGAHRIALQVADLNVGLIFILAMMSLAVYGVIFAGLTSRNNFAHLGGLRAASQMLAYEVTLGLAILGLVIHYGTLSLQSMVLAQSGTILGFLPAWGIFAQPVGFLLFLTAALAETKRVPFDLPEGESEIVGYFVEYSGMKFGMFFLTDLVETCLVACLVTTFFFGGWQVPFLTEAGFQFPWGSEWLLSRWVVELLWIGSFAVKVLFFNWFFMMIRWTLPRFRYDQLMDLGWKILFPASLVNVMVTSLLTVWKR